MEHTKISQIRISPEDVASTYDDGQDAFYRHVELYDAVVHHGMSPAEYAKSLGYRRSSHPKEYKNACSAVDRFKDGRYSFAVKGIVELNRANIFRFPESAEQASADTPFDISSLEDFTHENPLFELVAFIASIAFWSGNSHELKGQTGVSQELLTRELDPQIQQTFKPLIEHLDQIGLLSEQERSPDNLVNRRMRFHVGRLMHLLSGITGKKAESDIPVPAIFQVALRNLEDAHFACDESNMAYRILRDFIVVMFTIRGCKLEKNQYLVCTNVSHDAELAGRQMGTLERIIQQVDLSGMPLHTKLDTQMAKSGSYTYRIVTDRRSVDRLQYEAAGRIQELVRS